MKKVSVVSAAAAVVLLGFFLAWNPGFSEATVRVISGAQDPAQLATASILPVKVSSKTETILILYRDSADETTATGSAGDIKLTFYTTTCAKSTDVTVNLTRGDVELGDGTRYTIGKNYGSAISLFQATDSGVVLGEPVSPSLTVYGGPRWGMSGLVIDGDLGAVYERQGYPALVAQTQSTASSSYWAGFSTANFEDFYLQGSGFSTTVQLVCPDSTLMSDMNALATMTTTSPAYEIPTINVYGIEEQLLNSIHNSTCSCFKENPGSIQTYMANNTSVLGVFSIDMESTQYATGNRVIVLSTTAGNLYLDGRIRRATSTTLATP